MVGNSPSWSAAVWYADAARGRCQCTGTGQHDQSRAIMKARPMVLGALNPMRST
jgi:hypothetical protein